MKQGNAADLTMSFRLLKESVSNLLSLFPNQEEDDLLSDVYIGKLNKNANPPSRPADPVENSPADKKSKKTTPTSESKFPKYAAASFVLSQ